MTKRRLLRWSLILIILAGFAVWLEPTRVVWGWLRGEASYQGRPTSWWKSELHHWKHVVRFGSGPHTANWDYECTPSLAKAIASRSANIPEKNWPSLLDGDASAHAVLHELSQDSDKQVRFLAEEGLRRLKSDERGPSIHLNIFDYVD